MWKILISVELSDWDFSCRSCDDWRNFLLRVRIWFNSRKWEDYIKYLTQRSRYLKKRSYKKQLCYLWYESCNIYPTKEGMQLSSSTFIDLRLSKLAVEYFARSLWTIQNANTIVRPFTALGLEKKSFKWQILCREY